MKNSIRRLGSLLRQFASKKGWKNEDYLVRGYLNLAWGRINILVASAAYNDKDYEPLYDEITEFIDEKLTADDGLRNAVEIFLFGYYGPETDLPNLQGENDIDLTEELTDARLDVAATIRGS